MKHLSLQTLLCLHDGELAPAEARAAEEHIASCAVCAAEFARVAATLAEVATPTASPAPQPARQALQVQLAHASQQSRPVRAWLWFRQPRVLLRSAVVAVFILLAAVFQQLVRQSRAPMQQALGRYEETGPVPDPSLTPGAVAAVDASELCRRMDANLDPVLSPARRDAIFSAYRISGRERVRYQVDYLINPQLGGTDGDANLWPEPMDATVWNAAAKDDLERRLWGMVCRNELSLGTAQHDIAENWVGAYKKYFHASRPVSYAAAAGMAGR